VYAQAGQNVTLQVSQLYDQTNYNISLVAENAATLPLLMPDKSVAQVAALTAVTVYSLPINYVFELRVWHWRVLAFVLALLSLC